MKSFPIRTLYWPMLVSYFGFPVVRDLLPFYSIYGVDDWLAILALYVLGTILSFPLLYKLHKSKNKISNLKPSSYIVPIFGVFSQVVGGVFFWEDSISLYLYMAIVIVVSTIVLTYCSKNVIVVRDEDTGTLYKVRHGKLLRIPTEDLGSYQGMSVPFLISSSSIPGFDCSAPIVPFDSAAFGISSSGFNTGLTINPSSGLPMMGGVSGLDVNGNSFGTNFNDSNNTYDSSRGY